MSLNLVARVSLILCRWEGIFSMIPCLGWMAFVVESSVQHLAMLLDWKDIDLGMQMVHSSHFQTSS